MRPRRSVVLVLVILLNAVVHQAGGQALPTLLDEYQIRAIGPEDGLPISFIRRLLKTSDRKIYAATCRGLIRVLADHVEPVPVEGATSECASLIYEDPTGRVWILMTDGSLAYETEHGFVSANLPPVSLTGLSFTADGSAWSADGGLTRISLVEARPVATALGLPELQGGSRLITVFQRPGKPPVAIATNQAFRLSVGDSSAAEITLTPIGPPYELRGGSRDLVLSERGVWFPAGEGLVQVTESGVTAYGPGEVSIDEIGWYHSQDFQVISRRVSTLFRFPTDDPEASDLLQRSLHLAYRGSEETIWIALSDPSGGPHRLARMRAGRLEVIPLQDHLAFVEITGLIEDHEHSLWVQTDRGLIQVAPRKVAALTPKHGLTQGFTTGLLESSAGGLLIGTWGGGVNIFADGGLQRVLTTNDGLVDNRIRALYRDRSGVVWIGTVGGVATYEGGVVRPISLPSDIYAGRSFAESEDGSFWLAGSNRVFRNRGSGLESVLPIHSGVTDIWDIASFGHESLLIAARSGLHLVRDSTARLIVVDGVDRQPWMTGIFMLSDGSRWISSYDAGLYRLFGNQLVGLTPEDGLHAAGIWSMVEDDAGHVWMSSDRGLGVVRTDDLIRASELRRRGEPVSPLQPTVFRESEGMPSRESNRSNMAGIRRSDGHLVFNNIRGVAVVDPDWALREVPEPGVLIDRVVLDGVPVPGGGTPTHVRMEPGVRHIEVFVSALSYIAPSQISYQYRFEPDSEDWIPNGSDRRIAYANLPNGRHQLLVRARVGAGPWSERPAVLRVDVVPPFWQHPAVRLGFVLLLVAGIGSVLHMQRRRQRHLGLLVERRTAALSREKEKTARQAELLQSRATELKRLDETRTRFFANVSHEIRTPLTNASLLLEHLAEQDLGPKSQLTLERASFNLARLGKLSEDIILLSRVDCDELEFRPVRGDLASTLSALVSSYHPLADKHGISLLYSGAVDLVEADFDGKLLGHAVGNFISNGIKFSHRGGKVRVSLAVERDVVDVSVHDTGIGIEAEHMHHLFDRYFQGATHDTPGSEGMGLGLAVVREVAERMNGILNVRSTVGMGSTFTIRLPRWCVGAVDAECAVGGATEMAQPSQRMSSGLDTGSKESGAEGPKAAGKTVLIVEDNAETASLIETFLPHLKTAWVPNAAAARLFLETNRPDAVITDIMMPGDDGITLLDEIRTSETAADIPVLVVSARSAVDDRVRAFESHADAYLTKPFSGRELRTRIDQLLASRSELKREYRQRLELGRTGVEIASADEVFVRRLREIVQSDLESMTVERLASEAAVSPQHLRRRLKGVAGMSPSAFIREMRMLEAALQVRSRADQVQQIARRVGYRDVDSFRRHFRERFGASPGTYADTENRA